MFLFVGYLLRDDVTPVSVTTAVLGAATSSSVSLKALDVMAEGELSSSDRQTDVKIRSESIF